MTGAGVSRWSTADQPALGVGTDRSRDSGRDGFYDHLLHVCLLLLLTESPGASAELRERLRPLGFELTAKAVEDSLDGLADAGLVQHPDDDAGTGDAPASRRYAVTEAGITWLRGASKELRRTETVLGGFLARCGERLISLA